MVAGLGQSLGSRCAVGLVFGKSSPLWILGMLMSPWASTSRATLLNTLSFCMTSPAVKFSSRLIFLEGECLRLLLKEHGAVGVSRSQLYSPRHSATSRLSIVPSGARSSTTPWSAAGERADPGNPPVQV